MVKVSYEQKPFRKAVMQVFDGENAHSSSSFLSDAVIIAKNISNLNSNVSCPLYHARAEESASFFV